MDVTQLTAHKQHHTATTYINKKTSHKYKQEGQTLQHTANTIWCTQNSKSCKSLTLVKTFKVTVNLQDVYSAVDIWFRLAQFWLLLGIWCSQFQFDRVSPSSAPYSSVFVMHALAGGLPHTKQGDLGSVLSLFWPSPSCYSQAESEPANSGFLSL